MRATECNPEYMEQKIMALIKDQPNCTVEIIRDEELLEKGLNMHYAVG